ncbi:MAG: hypothetical protein ACR650_09855 [Methylocystis sp.]
MSLANPLPRGTRVSPVYGADGVNAAFAVPFWFLDPLDLWVYVTPPGGGPPTLMNNGVGYSATGAGNPGGGTVTLTAVPALGSHVQIFGHRVPNRLTSVVNGGAIVSQALENEFDAIEATMQELRRDIDSMNGAINFAALPTTLPPLPGILWNNGGVLCIS